MTDISNYEIKDMVECCQSSGLEDLQSLGCYYTWNCNNKWSKLDRAMVNGQWYIRGLSGQANFLPSGILSDHSPCIVSILQHEGPKTKPFKFFNMWTNHEDFGAIVEEIWGNNIHGTLQFQLCRKLKLLKQPLKRLNEKHYSHISSRARRAADLLAEVQHQQISDPQNMELISKAGLLRKQATFLAEAERSFLSQQAKCNFLKNSDRCTKFFHAIVKRNCKRNHIAALCKEDGTSTSSNAEIVHEFLCYYQQLLGTSGDTTAIDTGILQSGPCISEGMLRNWVQVLRGTR